VKIIDEVKPSVSSGLAPEETEFETPRVPIVTPAHHLDKLEAAAAARTRPARLQSLDAFRGLTMALMLLVNNVALGSATPAQLQHAHWHQTIRLADFIYPWFLFCVGLAIPFSVASARKRGVLGWRFNLRVVRRAAILVLLGCVISSAKVKHPVFSMGVLQTIGLAYLVGALLYRLRPGCRLGLAGLLLLSYWAAIVFVPIPGVGRGVFEAGRNVVEYYEGAYLSGLHLSGLTAVIPTTALVLIGTALGDLVRRADRSERWKLSGMLAAGAVLTAGGLVWSASLEMNKWVWTPSFTLLTAGTGAIGLGLFYAALDMRGRRRWAFPLLVLGCNAIVAYVAPILFRELILELVPVHAAAGRTLQLGQWILGSLMGPMGRIAGGWTYTIAFIFAWWLVLWVLYRKRVFLRV
jgi:predicted acyltransferase